MTVELFEDHQRRALGLLRAVVAELAPGQSEEVSVTETAQWRLGSNAILVNGIGTATDDDGTERTVHDAVGVIRYDEEG